jgi:hypothetical protein
MPAPEISPHGVRGRLPVAELRPVRRDGRAGTRVAVLEEAGVPAALQFAGGYLDVPISPPSGGNREAIAWQNTAYNQPPHPSIFIGNGM